MNKKHKRQITIRGDSVDIVERLSEVTGLTPRHVMELLLRKYGKELESWVGSPATQDVTKIPEPIPTPSVSNRYPEPSLDLPTDPGKGLKSIQL
jgi:hypothetical protein